MRVTVLCVCVYVYVCVQASHLLLRDEVDILTDSLLRFLQKFSYTVMALL